MEYAETPVRSRHALIGRPSIAEHYYRIKNPALATVGRRAMFEAIADYRSTS